MSDYDHLDRDALIRLLQRRDAQRQLGLVFDQFARRVLIGVPQLQPHLALSAPTIRAGIQALSGMDIVNELTGQRRNRVFAYSAYLDILREARSRCDRSADHPASSSAGRRARIRSWKKSRKVITSSCLS